MPYKDWGDQWVSEWTTNPQKGDNQNYTIKDGITYYPIWKNSTQGLINTTTQNLNNAQDPNMTAGGFGGVDYNYFTDLLKGYLENGDPNQGLYRQNAQGAINKSYNTAGSNLASNLAQSGLFRSGYNTAANIGLEGQRENAMGQAELGLAQQDQSFRQNALANLLGLQNLGLQETSQNRNYLLGLTNSLSGQLTNQQQLQQQTDQNKFNFFRDALPGLLELGGKAIAASDIRVKENVKVIGTTDEGLNHIEFNYIGYPQRYRGVIAQEVEKIKPEAVINVGGIKCVDYSQISVKHEIING